MKYCTNMSSGLSSREGGWRTDKEWWRGCWPCLYICMFKKLKRLAHTGLTFDLDLPQPSLHVISNPWLHMLVRWLYMIVLWRLACLPQTVNGFNAHTPLYKWQQVHEQTNTLHKHTHTLTHIQRSTHQKGLSLFCISSSASTYCFWNFWYILNCIWKYIFLLYGCLYLYVRKTKKCFVMAISGAL